MDWITAIDYLGTFVFAISGMVAAMNKKFDLFGVLILGMVTAIGGGTLRDLLIGSTPVGWMKTDVYFYIILFAMPIIYFFKNYLLKIRKGIFLFDTLGIGLFTILGLEKALLFGLSPINAVMMGIVTATFGGVIRDVLSNEVPLIFRKEIYAFACLFGAVIFLITKPFININLAMVISIASVIFIRIISIRRKWKVSFNP